MKTRAVNSDTLHHTVSGHGAPVVLVHGSASDGDTWADLSDALTRQFRVLSYSRRYHTPNAPIPPETDYSMAEHLDDLEAIVGALELGPSHFIGHSYGAFLCLLLAMRRPDIVRSLVLEEPPVLTLFASNIPTPAELVRTFVRSPGTALAIVKFGAFGVARAATAVSRGDREAALRFFGRAVLGRRAFDSLPRDRRDMARANFIDTEITGSGFMPLDVDEVREVSAPTLLLNGAESPRLFHHFARRLHELLPDSRRVIVPQASHIIHEDNPATCRQQILRFLTAVDGE